MTDAQLISPQAIRTVYESGAAKRLARGTRASVETVRAWLKRGVSASRRIDVALALRPDIDRRIAELSLLRERIDKMLEDNGRAVADPSKDKRNSSGSTSGEGAPLHGKSGDFIQRREVIARASDASAKRRE
jgi:hypothetical protein